MACPAPRRTGPVQALREEIGDEVIWQQLLAAMAADPQRFYPP